MRYRVFSTGNQFILCKSKSQCCFQQNNNIALLGLIFEKHVLIYNISYKWEHCDSGKSYKNTLTNVVSY